MATSTCKLLQEYFWKLGVDPDMWDERGCEGLKDKAFENNKWAGYQFAKRITSLL